MRLPKHVRDTFCSIAFELALALRVSVFRFLGSCCITLRTSNAFHVPCVVQQRRHTQNQVGKPIPTCQCTRVHKCTIARLLNERLLLCAQEGRERNAAFTRHISSRFRCGVRLFPITILRSTNSAYHVLFAFFVFGVKHLPTSSAGVIIAGFQLVVHGDAPVKHVAFTVPH